MNLYQLSLFVPFRIKTEAYELTILSVDGTLSRPISFVLSWLSWYLVISLKNSSYLY